MIEIAIRIFKLKVYILGIYGNGFFILRVGTSTSITWTLFSFMFDPENKNRATIQFFGKTGHTFHGKKHAE
jgi:hypothetical protein